MFGRSCIALTFVAAGVAAQAQPASAPTPVPSATLVGTTVSTDDAQFVARAAADGRAEVDIARLAQQKASADMVRQFAARMLTEHGKANDELTALARAKSLSLPTAPSAAVGERVTRLQRLAGAAFDREYMRQMVDDHKATVAAFENAARNGRDGQIKAFATKTLPTLQEHLRLAQAVHDGLPKS